MMQSLFTEEAFKNVSYLGSLNYNEIKNLINQATLCVFPSFAEALPVSWIEAIAVKKPVVASNLGWARSIIVASLKGFLVHPKNHIENANKILEIINSETLQKQLGENARKKIEDVFDVQKVMQQNVAFYKSLMK